MKHHFAHLNRIDVSVGQFVTKGQQIGLMGKTGTSSVHLHYEVQKIYRIVAYTKGMSKDTVLQYYDNPYNYDWRSIAPFSHLGWDWLSDIGNGQLHPGIDINSGAGDTDLNTPIKSPVSGKVVYANDDSAAGWGKHIFIEGDNMDKFTPDQARRCYEIIGRREPESDQVIQGRGFELVEGLNVELEGILRSKDNKITELENRPSQIIEKPVENPINLDLQNKVEQLTIEVDKLTKDVDIKSKLFEKTNEVIESNKIIIEQKNAKILELSGKISNGILVPKDIFIKIVDSIKSLINRIRSTK